MNIDITIKEISLVIAIVCSAAAGVLYLKYELDQIFTPKPTTGMMIPIRFKIPVFLQVESLDETKKSIDALITFIVPYDASQVSISKKPGKEIGIKYLENNVLHKYTLPYSKINAVFGNRYRLVTREEFHRAKKPN